MKQIYAPLKLCLFLALAITFFGYSQVGINTTAPASGALLDIYSSNSGLLIPKVSLTNTGDTTTITPSATVGLLVYNTVTSGALPFQVTPGYYYWNGSQWLRFYNKGYGIKFNQSAQTTANSLSILYTQIAGLDTGIISGSIFRYLPN